MDFYANTFMLLEGALIGAKLTDCCVNAKNIRCAMQLIDYLQGLFDEQRFF
ncbi:MAG: hypothetical protein RMJ87_10255 [Cytophagales bacterium]|nr:hypothetical protein [Bernardetiaceae bacterium]MDW8205401.1 hypothetical protein [Cytophagales bacterium]